MLKFQRTKVCISPAGHPKWNLNPPECLQIAKPTVTAPALMSFSTSPLKMETNMDIMNPFNTFVMDDPTTPLCSKLLHYY